MSEPEKTNNNDETQKEVKEEEAKEEKPIIKKVVPPELPLDWTKLGHDEGEEMRVRYPEDVAEINAVDLDICIVGTAGQKITVISNEFYKQCNPDLESLVLRSHLIQCIQGIQGFKKLHLLELYDNQVQELSCLEVPGPNLGVLDMSYNAIRDLSPVGLCVNLTELYIANNKLKQITGLKGLANLRKIDLGANRIRVMDEEELGGLINLEELWIGKNKIEQIQGLEKLTKLRRLDVQSNRLTKVENLTAQQETLEELYLAHNGIDDEGASQESGLALNFPQLNVLDLSRNQVTNTKSFAHLEALEELWLSGNKVNELGAMLPLKDSASAGIQNLETLYLEYNPVASDPLYRKSLAEWIPSLTQIDADLIGGLGAHGMQSAAVSLAPTVSLEEQMRQLQTTALEKAQEETQAYKVGQNQ